MWCIIQSTLLVVTHILHKEQRYSEESHWDLIQTLLECLHRSKPAWKRSELLSPKQSRINLTAISNSEAGGKAEHVTISISHILSGEATKANPALQVSVLQTPSPTTLFSFGQTIQVPNTTIRHKIGVIFYHLSKSTGFEKYLNSSFSSFILVPAALMLIKETLLSMWF